MAIIGNGAGPETGDGPQGGDLIKDGSQQSFMADVIDASKEALVLVDFWAPWCPPPVSGSSPGLSRPLP